mmetsp:Transcript_3209/g.7470  ORF Transcript_3209/g.7470 Transcript_3209/m.7470 type:complete len:224 (-) Transcript_3209:542-1213(-)
MLGDEHRSCFTCISGILLERETQEDNLLSRNSVEHSTDHLTGKAKLLMVVNLHNLVPVFSNLMKAKTLTKVYKVKNILLEARPTKTDGGIQEALPNSAIFTNGFCNLLDVGAGSLTQFTNGIDGRDTLGQESIGNKLRKLRRPEVRGDDVIIWNPVLVDPNETCNSCLSLLSHQTPNQNSIGLFEILHGCTLSEELRIGENLKADLAIIGHEDLAHRMSSTNR